MPIPVSQRHGTEHATEFRFDPQALADSTPGRVFLSARPDAFFKTELSPVQ